MSLTRHNKLFSIRAITVVFSLLPKSLCLRPIVCSIFFFLKDLFNSHIIDIRSIVCQRLVKISSIEVRKPPSSNKVHTSTRFSCNPVLGFAEIGRIIHFTFVGNKVTNLSFTGKTTISASWYGSRLRWRLKITANNENLSEDKLQNERKM